MKIKMSFLTKDTVVFVYILFYLFYKKKIVQNFELRPKRRPILLKVIKRGNVELDLNRRSL